MQDQNCYNCAYRDSIPGSAHIKCLANFKKIGKGTPKFKLTKWSATFPFNYDPVWMIGECPAWTDKREFVREETPFSELLSILGHRAL